MRVSFWNCRVDVLHDQHKPVNKTGSVIPRAQSVAVECNWPISEGICPNSRTSARGFQLRLLARLGNKCLGQDREGALQYIIPVMRRASRGRMQEIMAESIQHIANATFTAAKPVL